MYYSIFVFVDHMSLRWILRSEISESEGINVYVKMLDSATTQETDFYCILNYSCKNTMKGRNQDLPEGLISASLMERPTLTGDSFSAAEMIRELPMPPCRAPPKSSSETGCHFAFLGHCFCCPSLPHRLDKRTSIDMLKQNQSRKAKSSR